MKAGWGSELTPLGKEQAQRLTTGHDVVSFWLYNSSLNLLEWKRGRWHLVHLNL